MVELSKEWLEKAEDKISSATKGIFFQRTEARLIANFDLNDGAADDVDEELTLGKILGEGAFCHVKEISAINLNRRGDDDSSPTELSSEHKGETDEADFPINLFQNEADLREYMSDNCLREDGEGLHARYALKQLKSTNSQKHVEQGLLDLSIEAKFLSRINHPNVIKMRGLTGKPLSPNFGLVLDRLYTTLEDRMDMWTVMKKNSTNSGLCGCLGLGSLDEGTKANILISVVTIAYDLACGMRYIHEQNILYRDTKPENAGFDVRGDIKIFDFGFSKELSKDLFDKASRQYNLTKRTGSQPYLAPENFMGKPYGKPSDVFSFGVLLWEMLHSKFAFYHLPDPRDYNDVVCERNWRPKIDKSLPARLQNIITRAWDPDYNKRPSFKQISIQLKSEFRELKDGETDGLSRSERMLSASVRSFRVNRRR